MAEKIYTEDNEDQDVTNYVDTHTEENQLSNR